MRFFHDELRLSLPFNGELTLSLEALKRTSPRDIICIYEVPLQSLRMPARTCCQRLFFCAIVHFAAYIAALNT